MFAKNKLLFPHHRSPLRLRVAQVSDVPLDEVGVVAIHVQQWGTNWNMKMEMKRTVLVQNKGPNCVTPETYFFDTTFLKTLDCVTPALLHHFNVRLEYENEYEKDHGELSEVV